MGNPVIERLQGERASQIEFVDNLLAKIEADGRDPVDAETANLRAAKERVEAIDAQLGPLVEFESLRDSAQSTAARLLSGAPENERRTALTTTATGGYEYRSAAELMADRYKAGGDHTRGLEPDRRAAERLAAAEQRIVNQTTTDTPGLLPTELVGPVVDLLDTNRPLISSLGVHPLGTIPGKTFSRPKVVQHTTVGEQTAEKTELPSQKMLVNTVDFAKRTFGGTVNVSRQDIDWTSPSAWDILIRDLAGVYAKFTEASACADFAAAASGGPTVATDDLTGWSRAIYTAAATAYKGGQLMPNMVWCSVDMWAQLGSLADQARLAMPPRPDGNAGTASIASFAGDMFAVPRIVCPGLPDGTIIVGNNSLFEVYEHQIGLLSAIEPSIVGVEVAYAGYAAWGSLEGAGFVTVKPPVAPGARASK